MSPPRPFKTKYKYFVVIDFFKKKLKSQSFFDLSSFYFKKSVLTDLFLKFFKKVSDE